MRYLIFAFDYYYPAGGADDIKHATNSDVLAYGYFRDLSKTYEAVQVFDSVTNKVSREK
jgi:hypothetical protein